jgi:hypothetical protein
MSQAAVSTPQATTKVVATSPQGHKNKMGKNSNKNGMDDEPSVVRKRKRASANKTETPSRSLEASAQGSFVVGGDILHALESSMGNLSSNFAYVPTPALVQYPEKRSKKKRKSEINEKKEPASSAAKKDARPMEKKSTNGSTIGFSNLGASMPQTPTKMIAANNAASVKETPVPLPSDVSTHLSPPMSLDNKEPTISSSTRQVTRTVDIEPKSQAPLTVSNLVKYTQPLNDTPKPKPRPHNVLSGAASTVSSVSSLDVRGDLTRTSKPYSRSGAEIDPFVTPCIKKTIRREFHEESHASVFKERYRKSRKTVNFSDEAEYLDKHFEWQFENNAKGLLPCLGVATGCNSKREQVLRLSKEDPSNLLKILVTTDSEHDALDDAKSRCTAAEYFLIMAVAARVPVPIGRVEGVWSLYCPSYSQFHVDKYGFGQRTLSIFSMPSLADPQAYTARLSIPPRSMLYSVLSFTVPPHASFRTTTIRTSAEGYKMQLVFLGNGYLQLRVDLNLLLRGKPTETAEGKSMYMEFIGVHENAVVWRKKEDELEVEGRKLFAKYDGGLD